MTDPSQPPQNPVARERAIRTSQALKSPRAAAIAGILFAILFATSYVLLRLAVPEQLSEANAQMWLRGNQTALSVALTLLPFAGIAFMWFIGVIRDRVGKLEDQLFATVLIGSGLLFLAMIFAAAAVADGTLTAIAIAANPASMSGVALFASATTYTIMRVYAIRMAGVFMISLSTIWMRTGNMPRLFAFVTYGLAIIMLLAFNISAWLILVLPAWVFVVSVYILFVQSSSHD